MGFRLRKSIKIAPGVKLNLSKSGISTTIGKRGASINVGKKGTYSNIGVPGTGISMRNKIGGGNSSSNAQHGSSGYNGAHSYGPDGIEQAATFKVSLFTLIFGIWALVMTGISFIKEGVSVENLALPLILTGLPILLFSSIAFVVTAIRKKPKKTWGLRVISGLLMFIAGMILIGSTQ